MKFCPCLGIRCKLIAIFVLIKVLPLIALAWIAWSGITLLGGNLKDKFADFSGQTQEVIGEVSDLAVESSIRALDLKSRDNIERLTTDTARAVAHFLYERDDDIRLVASLPTSVETYRMFLNSRVRTVINHAPWKLNAAGKAWEPVSLQPTNDNVVDAENEDNAKDFHYRPPEANGIPEERPLYLELTFVDLNGVERIKVANSDILSPELKDISDPANTYCKAEKYFDALKKLKPGEIYVSEVIGPYIGSPIIGTYTKEKAEARGIPFEPEKAAYAGKENPVGKRFQGLIRWAMPVVDMGKIKGWVTLALDHTHVMEFTDHLLPTDERYSPIPDAGAGNYAFIWDYKDRNISHPRDYFITGYDPETGEPATPWLETAMYENFLESGQSVSEWEKGAPVMDEQSLDKKPSKVLTDQGLLGLDCRYLNFAPQCEGWYNLTKDGGSGSFVIFWSGLWKLTTAAAIPYFTGQYGDTPRGFGFVTIGANVHEFHKAATETGDMIKGMALKYASEMAALSDDAQIDIRDSLRRTAEHITYSTAVMIVLVIFVAIWMASTLTRKVTRMIRGIRLFQKGDMDHRLTVESQDEIGQLTQTFNDMADDIQGLIESLQRAEEKYRSFFENSTVGIYRSLETGELTSVNASFARLFGYASAGEMMAEVKHVGEERYIHSSRRKELISLLNAQDRVIDFEYEIRRRDGVTRTLQTSCYWISDSDGQRYLEGMSIDITERKEAIKALEESKDKAEQLSLMKSNFLSMVSHELRTPLTSIIGFAKLIHRNLSTVLKSEDIKDGTAKTLERIQANTKVITLEGDRLTELINNVLDLAKLEAGKFEWHIGTVSIQEIVEHSISATEVLLRDKGVTLEQEIDPDIPLFVADRDRLVQVCINLLSNAAKFTHKGKVRCEVSQEGQNAMVRVYDSGIGVPEGEEEAIFDKFRQLGDTLTDKPKGTGLGLPICKEIVEFHSGWIWCEANPTGGSIFGFSIPLNCPLPID